MIKDITFGADAHQKIKAGVDKLANVVKSTLGPGGTNVIVQRGDTQVITKDGVSVAREIWLSDPIENMGAQIVKEAAERTVSDAGDGTTTATVLAQAIFSRGIEQTKGGGIWKKPSPKLIDVKRGIDLAVAEVVKQIREMSKPVEGDDINKVALISSNGDTEIGGLVGDAVTQVGLEGLVTVEDSKSLETFLKKVDGMRWDRGYLSPYFITHPAISECQLEDPVILIYDGVINSLREVMGNDKYNIIDRYRNYPDSELKGKPLLIICHEAGAEFLSTMAVNHQNKAIQCCIVQAPEFQQTRKAILHDIAAMTGATVISKEAGYNWKDVKPEHLGRCGRVRVSQWATTIIDGAGGLKAINRANELREQMKETNEHALVTLKSRLARLVNGLMVIYVGGGSEIEVKEKKDRLDDSLNATRSAIEEGVLPGGGIAYLNARERIDFDTLPYTNADQKIGGLIVRDILSIPLETIVSNVGGDPDGVIQEIIHGDHAADYGFNAQTRTFERLIETGVIDPTKVVRLALENASSVAGMLLTTKAVVSYALKPQL